CGNGAVRGGNRRTGGWRRTEVAQRNVGGRLGGHHGNHGLCDLYRVGKKSGAAIRQDFDEHVLQYGGRDYFVADGYPTGGTSSVEGNWVGWMAGDGVCSAGRVGVRLPDFLLGAAACHCVEACGFYVRRAAACHVSGGDFSGR